MNVEELSKHLLITARRVQQLTKMSIFRREARGDYPLDECKRQYQKYIERREKKEEFAVDINDLASCLGLEVKQVDRLIKSGTIRCYETVPGRFDLMTAIKSYISHIRRMAQAHRARERSEKTQQALGMDTGLGTGLYPE